MNDEKLIFIVQRIDSYISNTNTKATILLGLNTFIVGGMVNSYVQLKLILSISILTHLLTVASIFGIIISSIYSIKAIIPAFLSENKNDYHKTGIFFAAISRLSENDYRAYIRSDEYDFFEDVTNQIVELSRISFEKHNYLKHSIYSLVMITGVPWTLIFFVLLFGGLL